MPGHDVWQEGLSAAITEDLVDSEVIEALRLEQGIPSWDAELTPTTLPPEGGPRMLKAISYTKGCYVGQEVIARLKSVGHVNRTLVFLTSETDAFPQPLTKLTHGEKEVGTITSGGFSPRLQRGIALGYLQRTLAADGTDVVAQGLELKVTPPVHFQK